MDNKSVIKLLILNYFIRTCHVFKEKVTTRKNHQNRTSKNYGGPKKIRKFYIYDLKFNSLFVISQHMGEHVVGVAIT